MQCSAISRAIEMAANNGTENTVPKRRKQTHQQLLTSQATAAYRGGSWPTPQPSAQSSPPRLPRTHCPSSCAAATPPQTHWPQEQSRASWVRCATSQQVLLDLLPAPPPLMAPLTLLLVLRPAAFWIVPRSQHWQWVLCLWGDPPGGGRLPHCKHSFPPGPRTPHLPC